MAAQRKAQQEQEQVLKTVEKEIGEFRSGCSKLEGIDVRSTLPCLACTQGLRPTACLHPLPASTTTTAALPS